MTSEGVAGANSLAESNRRIIAYVCGWSRSEKYYDPYLKIAECDFFPIQ
jgi:hypothetical protein